MLYFEIILTESCRREHSGLANALFLGPGAYSAAFEQCWSVTHFTSLSLSFFVTPQQCQTIKNQIR